MACYCKNGVDAQKYHNLKASIACPKGDPSGRF